MPWKRRPFLVRSKALPRLPSPRDPERKYWPPASGGEATAFHGKKYNSSPTSQVKAAFALNPTYASCILPFLSLNTDQAFP